MGYNVDVTLECRDEEDAQRLAGIMFFGGFYPDVNGNFVRVIANDICQKSFEYLLSEIDGNGLIIGSFFKPIDKT